MEQWLKFCFSTFHLPRTDDTESCGRQSRVDSGNTFVSYTGLVPPSAETTVLTQQKQSSSVNYYEDGGFQVIGKYLTCGRVSTETAKIIISSSRESTINQYGSHFKRRVLFCGEQQIDVINPSVNDILNYLTMLYQGHTCHISHCEIKSHRIWPIWKAIPVKKLKSQRISDHFL